jgi:hypothetical protein
MQIILLLWIIYPSVHWINFQEAATHCPVWSKLFSTILVALIKILKCIIFTSLIHNIYCQNSHQYATMNFGLIIPPIHKKGYNHRECPTFLYNCRGHQRAQCNNRHVGRVSDIGCWIHKCSFLIFALQINR